MFILCREFVDEQTRYDMLTEEITTALDTLSEQISQARANISGKHSLQRSLTKTQVSW